MFFFKYQIFNNLKFSRISKLSKKFAELLEWAELLELAQLLELAHLLELAWLLEFAELADWPSGQFRNSCDVLNPFSN